MRAVSTDRARAAEVGVWRMIAAPGGPTLPILLLIPMAKREPAEDLPPILRASMLGHSHFPFAF